MKKTVLFDLDGTLLHSEPDFTSILNDMLRDQGRTVSHSQMRQTVSNGARAMVQLASGLDESHPDFPRWLEDFLDRYDSRIPSTGATLFQGIASMLTTLEQEGYIWGIVTNKSSRFTIPLLQQFNEFSNATTTVCADQVKIAKPDPEGLILACSRCNTEVGNAIYVGDHPRDIEAAINAGMPGIAVTWGYLPASPPVKDWHASAVIHQPEDLLALLEQNL